MISIALPLVALLGLLAGPTAEEVARIQYEGDATGALQLAREAVAAGAQDTSVRLAGACAAIEANKLDLAADFLSPLERAHGTPPRVRVLRHLITLRKARPSDPLLLALATAWHRSGRPDLAKDEPALGLASTTPLPPLTSGDASVRLLFGPPVASAERASVAIEASRLEGRQPLVVALEVLGALTYLPCSGDAGPRNEAVQWAARTGSEALAGNGYVALASTLARCPAPTWSDLADELHRIASAPLLAYPRDRTFEELWEMARAHDPRTAKLRAICAWLALDIAGIQLKKLSEAPLARAPGARSGRDLEAIGWRLAEGSGWLERMLGVGLAQRGAELGGDSRWIEEVRRKVEAKRGAYRVSSDLQRQLGRWPFAAEWQEWTPDEVGSSMAFLKAVQEPSGANGVPARR